ncbi:MAG: TetR/AcrR family transcriptional regulator [Anaerolineales bacterium]|nr:TetR/AcrR family transcriptional regulator [Chloroflexota bacterium]MBL6983238.1 TetR/AcrR family transcriptional regulator [Anaerolineales bacterium]
MLISDWSQIHTHILQFEQEGLVTRTFRRLDPERQQTVLNAILEEASEKGPASLNIKEVARRAEVSIGSLYQYFGNREGLLDFTIALCVRYLVDLFSQFKPMLSALPLEEGLRYYILGGVEWSQTEAGLARFFGRAAYQGDPALSDSIVRPIAEAMRNTVEGILTQAAERGEIQSDVDYAATVRVINSLMIAVGDALLFPFINDYFQVTDADMPHERVVDAMVNMILRGIGK